VRNYEARNFMRDAMRPGDGVLFFHSSCAEPGIAGLAEVATAAYPDASQFDRSSAYFDPKATRAAPRWFNVEVRALRKTRLLPLAELRQHRPLAKMWVLRQGSRLSITPVSAAQWNYVTSRLLAA
jgi:predicted RNA-binding protein with PUA-like domain